MTRQCLYCQKIMGEKCPKCGAPAAYNGTPQPFWYCPTHGLYSEGEGGISSAVCPACLTKAKQELAGEGKGEPSLPLDRERTPE